MTGKSCLVKRFCEKKFYDRFKPTIGIDYGTRKFTHHGNEMSIDFWDMSGHREFEEIRKEFYDNVQVCLLVFDCTDQETFDNLDQWLKETKKYEMTTEAVKYVVCNKVDSRYRGISTDQAKEWCYHHEPADTFKYFETSSKSGKGVEEMFTSVFRQFLGELV